MAFFQDNLGKPEPEM